MQHIPMGPVYREVSQITSLSPACRYTPGGTGTLVIPASNRHAAKCAEIRYIHTYIHSYIHTYIHTYIHSYIHSYIPSYYLPRILGARLLTARCRYLTVTLVTRRDTTLTYRHSSFPFLIYTCIHSYIHIRTQVQYAHTYIHTYPKRPVRSHALFFMAN